MFRYKLKKVNVKKTFHSKNYLFYKNNKNIIMFDVFYGN